MERMVAYKILYEYRLEDNQFSYSRDPSIDVRPYKMLYSPGLT